MRPGFLLVTVGTCFLLTLSGVPLGATVSAPKGLMALSGIFAHNDVSPGGAAQSSPSGLLPTQVRHAYGFDQLPCYAQSSCGFGQVIAIVDAYDDPNIASDLSTFSTQFGLPACTVSNGCFAKLTPEGQPGQPPPGSNWALEEALDVQWVHAIAPNAKIILVESYDNSVSEMLGAVDFAAAQPGVHQVSNSWGAPEFWNESSYDSHFQISGVSFFASSGDYGYEDIEWPAVSSYVIGVGGTTLNVNSQGSVQSEVGWIGSSGGLSQYVSEPTFQSGFQSKGMRGVPDVSYDADPATGVPVYDSFTYGGWVQVGGDSVGSPQWAAMMAIVNSERGTPISLNAGTLDATIYGAAAGGSYASDFRDITTGYSSDVPTTCYPMCYARVGYDFVTGLGSPLANNLVPFLVATPPGTIPSPYVTFSETGLPIAAPWNVAIQGGSTSSGAGTSIVIYGITANSISYSITGPSCGSECQYYVSPSSGTINPVVTTTVPVTFTLQYYLTMNQINNGKGLCGIQFPVSGWVNGGGPVTLTARYPNLCTWQGWAGSGHGSYTGLGTVTRFGAGYQATQTITMIGPINETGTFYCINNCSD